MKEQARCSGRLESAARLQSRLLRIICRRGGEAPLVERIDKRERSVSGSLTIMIIVAGSDQYSSA